MEAAVGELTFPALQPPCHALALTTGYDPPVAAVVHGPAGLVDLVALRASGAGASSKSGVAARPLAHPARRQLAALLVHRLPLRLRGGWAAAERGRARVEASLLREAASACAATPSCAAVMSTSGEVIGIEVEVEHTYQRGAPWWCCG